MIKLIFEIIKALILGRDVKQVILSRIPQKFRWIAGIALAVILAFLIGGIVVAVMLASQSRYIAAFFVGAPSVAILVALIFAGVKVWGIFKK